MKLLAIDSSGLVAGVALVENDTLIAEYTLNHKKTHSQTLLPMIDELFKMTGIPKTDLDAVAIAAGPGSFTGLRIGAATAKGLGLALNIPLIRVPTVDAYAYNLFGTRGIICPMMDARRSQVYTGLYKFEGSDFKVVKPQCAVGIDEITEEINKLGEPVILTGDGVDVDTSLEGKGGAAGPIANRNYVTEHLTVPFEFAPSHLARQRAGALGALAVRYMDDESYPSIKKESAAEFVPEYLRLSQAERERLENV